ncbi:MAG TPA: precorrin-4 C(11)-methyltransferase, partial [Isosphaeraceae bacterium]|nr:precorrin-4 C(11)-methyltransferase [Isosphaeraceae bacterium]
LSAGLMPEVKAALEPHYGPDAKVVIAHRVSWPDQQILHTTVAEASRVAEDAQITRTALILVGPMLDETAGEPSRLYDPKYSHIFRKSRGAQE